MKSLFLPLALLLLFACSDDGASPDLRCSSMVLNPEYGRMFHVKWVDGETVEILSVVAPNPGSDKLGEVPVRLYQSDDPNGEWELLNERLISFPGPIDSLRLTLPNSSTGLRYYRLHFEHRCFAGFDDYIIATVKPYSHPSSWETGPTLKGDSTDSEFVTGVSALSPDGSQLATPWNGGTIFDLVTASKIEKENFTDVGGAHISWYNGYVFSTGGNFKCYDVDGDSLIASQSATYSFFKDDTSVVYRSGNSVYSFKLDSLTEHKVDSFKVESGSIANTIPSPNGRYIACTSTSFDSQHKVTLLDAGFNVLRTVVPAGSNAPPLADAPYCWTDNGDVLYFWEQFSGASEIWAYSISQDRYYQVTGYQTDAYTGRYADYNPATFSYTPSTMMMTWHPQKAKLMLFFRTDVDAVDVRYMEAVR